MKKLQLLLLCFFTLLTAGCATNSLNTESDKPLFISLDPIESYDDESRFFIDTESTGSQVEEDSTKGFLVKEKKYSYQGNDLVLLDVTNESNQNYSVTIIGNYLDMDGNVLKTESQCFDGFAANYQTYFLFMPKITFASFTYTIEVQTFEGACLAPEIDILDGKRRIDKWTTQQTMHQLITTIEYQNKSKQPLTAALTCILFDKNGDIYQICIPGIKEAPAGEIVGPSIKMYIQYSENAFTYPERLDHDYVEILAFVNKVFTTRDEMLQWLNSEGNELIEWYGEYGIPTDDFRK